MKVIINKSILDAIKEIQNNVNEINTRSNISLARLQSAGERLFDSLFVYENYPNPTNEGGKDYLKVKFIEGIEKIDYPLGVVAYEDKEELIFK